MHIKNVYTVAIVRPECTASGFQRHGGTDHPLQYTHRFVAGRNTKQIAESQDALARLDLLRAARVATLIVCLQIEIR